MEFRFEGYIREIGPLETVTFKDATLHTKCEVIITTDEQRPNTLGISFWDNDARMICNAVSKQYISVDYNAKADFVKGKNGVFVKNNLKAWRYQLGQINPNLQWAEATIPGYQQAAAPQQVAPPPQLPPQQAAPQQVAAAPLQAPPPQLPPQQAVPQQVAMQVNGLPNPVMLNPPF